MSARRFLPVAAALLALAACNGTKSKPGPRFLGPSGLALFKGVSSQNATQVHPYLAVTNLRGDEVRILNPEDGSSVLAPGRVLSLSVPTEAQPALVAAGALADAVGDKPDLLAVASTGTSSCPTAANPAAVRLTACIQVVQTWAEPDGAIRTAVADDLAIALAEVPGAEDALVRALAVLPATDAAGVVVPGKARLAAALDGGRLLLADFARTAQAGQGDAILADGAPVVLDLGFDALSLAASPGGGRLYAASTDPLPGATPVLGVAEVDVTGPLSAAPRWRALDAGGPTTVVMAALVRRFTGFGSASAGGAWDPAQDLYGAEVLRVYAARQPGSCGPTLPVACGLVVLDPVTGGADGTGGRALEPAPAHPTAERYQAEIPVTGRVVALAAIPPPAVGGQCDDRTAAPCLAGGNPISTTPYQPRRVGSTSVWASTLAAVVSDNGNVYLLDLGHDGPSNQGDWLSSDSANSYAQVLNTSWAAPVTGHLELAMWDTLASPAALTRDLTRAKALVRATPGFTPSDTWSVSWQGSLPGLLLLDAQAQVDASGTVAWVAIQTPTGNPAAPFTGVGHLYDARYPVQPAIDGVRLGDIVRVTPIREPGDAAPLDTSVTPEAAAASQYCPFGTFELEVTALLPPSAEHPGGALQVREPAWRNWTQPANDFGTTPAGATRTETADPKCMRLAGAFTSGAGAASALKPVTMTVLSGELLLTAGTFGYAGRPTTRAGAGAAYLVQHDASLDPASCPRLEAATLPADACDPACQARCEALLLSRKARRFAYVYSQCAATDATCRGLWSADASTTVNKVTFPNPGGPVVGLDLAWTSDGTTPVAPDLTDAATWPARGTLLTVVTLSGQTVEGRKPVTSGVAVGTLLPTGVAIWDRPDFTRSSSDRAIVYTAYPANQIMGFGTTAAASEVTLIR